MKKTHNFGIELPKTVAKANEPDKNNVNTFWADEISKDMKNVKIAFDIMPDVKNVPNGYKQIHCYMIFDVKMEDFRRKARLVADIVLCRQHPRHPSQCYDHAQQDC